MKSRSPVRAAAASAQKKAIKPFDANDRSPSPNSKKVSINGGNVVKMPQMFTPQKSPVRNSVKEKVS